MSFATRPPVPEMRPMPRRQLPLALVALKEPLPVRCSSGSAS